MASPRASTNRSTRTTWHRPSARHWAGQHLRRRLRPQRPTGIDLTPLTAFAGDDREAAQEILRTFLQETQRHAESFRQACERKDKAEACRLAHKMLPTFTLVGAPCIGALQALDSRRDEPAWTTGDDAPAREILQAFAPIVGALQACIYNKNI